MQRIETSELAARAQVCESRAYHLVDAIQPHAALMVLDTERLIVVRASRNIEKIAGQPIERLFGVSVLDLVDTETKGKLLDGLSEGASGHLAKGRFPLSVRFKAASESRKRIALFYLSGAYICLEFPDDNDTYESREEILDTLLFRLVDEITGFDGGVSGFGQILCKALYIVTGFERIYLCEFDGDDHGYISAEYLAGDIASLLNHHFPRTDIPQRVRAIYLKNPFRTIPDIDAHPIPIETSEGRTLEPLDLSYSTCRQVATTHLQYVRNMGVRASASFSIIENGRLEGLFGGHHRQPHLVAYHRLAMAQHLVDLYRTRLSFLKLREREDLLKQKQCEAQTLCAKFLQAGCRLDAFTDENWGEWLKLMDADDFIGRFEDQFFAGRNLAPDEAKSIVRAVSRAMPETRVLVINSLADLAPELYALRKKASGCLAVSLDSEGRDLLIWLRPEKILAQKWSGDPDEAILAGGDGSIGPRRSFATYMKLVKGSSRPWDDLYAELARHVIHAANQSLSNYYNLKARRAAERVSELNGEFISKVSHELRSPIHALIGLSDAIIEKAETLTPEKRRQYKTILKERGQRLLYLLNDLLEISKLETRVVAYNFAEGDIRAVIETCFDEVASLAERKSVGIEIQDTRNHRYCVFDPARMTQVIVNLFLNAIKFSPLSSRIIVRLSDESADDAGESVLIEVADQGVGVPEQEREAIFGKFVKSSRTDGVIAGIGLGLPICREIVLGHSGQLWVENNALGGASFFVRLPRDLQPSHTD